MIYAVLSDIHAYAPSIFAHTGRDGVNNRLRIIIEEMRRAAQALVDCGGKTMFIAGDILHTRGVIDPEVLNPVRQVIDNILGMGVNIYAIPGNHDLKSKDSQELSSSIQNLDQISLEGTQFQIFNKASVKELQGQTFGFVPWRWTQEALLEDLEAMSKAACAKDMDVFIHAGIDGVLSGMPAHGLTSAMLKRFGFRNVFAGHYHNHVQLEPGVWSIGATTHHNWGDVGTRAGFLLVDTDTNAVGFNDTLAPKFVDVSGLDEFEMELECKGNYVRFRGPSMTQPEITELREAFKKWGALGTSIEVPKTAAVTRTTAPSKGLSLEQSVEAFVMGAAAHPRLTPAAIVKRSLEILDLSRVTYEEA